MTRTCSARAPRSSPLARAIGLVLVLALAEVGLGQPLHGTIDTTLYRFDPGAPGATLVGTMALKPQHVSLRLARQPNGGLIGIATTFFFPTTSVYTVDPVTAVATPIVDFPVPPLSSIDAVALHPGTGILYYFNQSVLKTVDPATGAGTTLGSPAPPGELHGLAFDPQGRLYSLNLLSFTLWKIDVASLSNSGPIGPLGTVLLGADLTYDGVLGSLVGYHRLSGQPFVIDSVTGHAAPPFPATSPSFDAIVGRECGGHVQGYGFACGPGSTLAPSLTVVGCPAPGRVLAVTIAGGIGGAPALLLFGAGQGAVPIGGGCLLELNPLLPLSITVPLGGAGPGAGSAVLSGTIPPQVTTAVFTMQACVADPSSGLGFTTTNAVRVDV